MHFLLLSAINIQKSDPVAGCGGRDCGLMKQVSGGLLQAERFVDCSKSMVIGCRCGEKLLLLGRASDWDSEGRTVFECGGCGKKLSLKDGR